TRAAGSPATRISTQSTPCRPGPVTMATSIVPSPTPDRCQCWAATSMPRSSTVGLAVTAPPASSAFKAGPGHRVDVGVDDPRGRIDPLDHLMGVADGGQAGSDVDELPQAGLGGQPRGRPLMEPAVRPGRVAERGQAQPQRLGGLVVHLE